MTVMVFEQIHWFFFPRKGALKEHYPLENSIKMILNFPRLLDYITEMYERQYRETGSKTFII